MNHNLLATLKHSWTAVIRQNNGQLTTIWHTSYESEKHIIKEVVSISSDYPKHTIKS